ncbi:MAG: Hsp33 family molecular chaperone HslO [Firmicutes bacterium HGW-Firmicutes-18]|nr:MAG: Hsp33 family molecular chaperone HslO [Firmicutes bacterium HGW-Firmicutes-18]
MRYIIRGIDKNITFRFFAVDTKEVVEQARIYHNTTPVASAALGRALTASLMMGYTLKNKEDKLTVKINGGGPLGTILVTADSMGHVKGYVDNPQVDLDVTDSGKLNVGGAVGKEGFIQVIKDMGLKEPYSGSSMLVSGEIGEDVAAYFYNSEQQPTVVGLGVLVDTDHTIKSAGGFMLQLMPGLNDDEITAIESAIAKINNVSSFFEKEQDLEQIMGALLPDFELVITEKALVSYRCDCSLERMREVLISLGEKEIEDIIEEDKKAEIHCHFCNKRYQFDEEDLNGILETISNDDHLNGNKDML